jgi:transcriptional regulator with XRE-family HTH domain
MNATSVTKQVDLIEEGKKARIARLNAKMTYGQMMDHCDLSQRTIKELETGRYHGNFKRIKEKHEAAITSFLSSKTTKSDLENKSLFQRIESAVRSQNVKESDYTEEQGWSIVDGSPLIVRDFTNGGIELIANGISVNVPFVRGDAPDCWRKKV